MSCRRRYSVAAVALLVLATVPKATAFTSNSESCAGQKVVLDGQ
jgi:hypothetical protein